MPTYEYRCACGLQFDGRARVEDHSKPKECPSCHQGAEPLVPSQVQGHFSKEVTGPMPQNTGIQGLDAHIDRVIGQSAKQGFDTIFERVQDKKDFIAATGASGKDLSKNPDGTYRVMSPEERAAHERSQANHKAAMRLIAPTWKTSRPPNRPR